MGKIPIPYATCLHIFRPLSDPFHFVCSRSRGHTIEQHSSSCCPSARGRNHLMLNRGKLGMLAVIYRSLHLAGRNGVIATAFTTSPSFLFTKPSTTTTATIATTATTVVVARGRPLTACSSDNNTISGVPKSIAGGGSGGTLKRKERGGGTRGRGMSSASYGGGRGGRGGRARNGRRAPPDYGPDRPGQHR